MITTLCMFAASLLSKTSVKGLSAGASTWGVSKPCAFEAVIVTVEPDATGPPEVCGAPDWAAEPDGPADAAPLGAADPVVPDAPGEPDAAVDGGGVIGGAGAYVQPGGVLAQPASRRTETTA